eukprot:2738765-Pleurochrysis_carterae.AAC.1
MDLWRPRRQHRPCVFLAPCPCVRRSEELIPCLTIVPPHVRCAISCPPSLCLRSVSTEEEPHRICFNSLFALSFFGAQALRNFSPAAPRRGRSLSLHGDQDRNRLHHRHAGITPLRAASALTPNSL